MSEDAEGPRTVRDASVGRNENDADDVVRSRPVRNKSPHLIDEIEPVADAS